MGAKGEKKEAKKLISSDEILEMTNGGWDIFCKEIGKFPVGRSFKHPLKEDRKISGSIVKRGNLWFLCDFAGTFKTMTAIKFIELKYKTDFKGAISRICKELSINEDNKEYQPDPDIQKEPKLPTEYVHISFSTSKFDKKHAEYWNSYHLSEDYLKKYNVFRVKDLFINRRRIALKSNELTYAYWADDIQSTKILRVGAGDSNKWRTNVPNDYIWYENLYEGCDKLIISKSVKDALVLTLFNICSVATQNESAKILSSNIQRLSSKSKELIINYGSDYQGKEESWKITKKFGIKHYNTPDELLKFGVNDVAEMAKYDINLLEKHLKQKKII